MTTATNCSWTSVSSVAWISITAGGSGSGNGPVAYSVARNDATEARAGTLTIAGQSHTVTQQGKPATVCSYELSPGGANVGLEETRGTFAVTAPADCAWTAASNASWLTVTGGGSGNGSGTVAYLVERNRSIDGRTAAITVADKTFTLQQNGDGSLCQYSVAPVAFDACMPASAVSATVTAPQGCTWTAVPNASWLTIASGSSGSGTGSITITLTDNYDAPREGIVMVRWPTVTAGQNLRIAQAGCQYAVSQSSFTFTLAGGSGSFDVLQQAIPNTCGGATQDRCVWSATADVPWISIGGSMPRSGDGRVTFTVAANGTGAARVGRITMRDKVVVVNQGQ